VFQKLDSTPFMKFIQTKHFHNKKIQCIYAETVFSFLTTWGPRSCKISIMSTRKRVLKYKSISSSRQELHRRCNLFLHRTVRCKGRNLHRWQKYEPLPIVHKTVDRGELSVGCNIDIAQPKTPSLVHHMHIVRPKKCTIQNMLAVLFDKNTSRNYRPIYWC
jgi:hypothetical protein